MGVLCIKIQKYFINFLASLCLTPCAKVQKYNRAEYVSNFFIYGANNAVEHYGKRIKIQHGCPFEGWLNKARPFWQKGLGWPCPVRSVLNISKGHLLRILSLFPYCSIKLLALHVKKIGDLFWPVHISRLSHSVLTWLPTSWVPEFDQFYDRNKTDLLAA